MPLLSTLPVGRSSRASGCPKDAATRSGKRPPANRTQSSTRHGPAARVRSGPFVWSQVIVTTYGNAGSGLIALAVVAVVVCGVSRAPDRRTWSAADQRRGSNPKPAETRHRNDIRAHAHAHQVLRLLLDAGYAERPSRFHGPPSAPRLPEAAWINRPEEAPLATASF